MRLVGAKGRTYWLSFTALFLLAGAVPGQAQNVPPPTAASPARPSTVRFDISAQPLDTALAQFGVVSGVQVLYDAKLAHGRNSPGVRGDLTPRQALGRLLAGTGLAPRFSGNRTASIFDPSDAGGAAALGQGVTLDTINVQGESAKGPVRGFVARRSATGTKTDAALIETPQSISVVTRDQIDAQKADSIKQALRYTAGVAAENRANFGSTDITYSRGFILNRFVDGLKLQGDAAFVTPQPELYGMERVEVLRGPASVLYGLSSPGGIINLVSKVPTAQPYHEVQVQGGSFEKKQGAFDLSGPIDPQGQFLYRLTGLARDANNQVDFVKDERYFIAPAFTWRPTADTNFTVLVNYQNDPHAGLYNFVPYNGSVAFNPNGKVPRSFYAGDPNFNTIKREQGSVGYNFEHRFDNVWTVRQNARYQDMGGTLNQVLPLLLLGDQRTLMRYAQRTDDRIKTLSIDTQAEAKVTTGPLAHTLLFGVDYSHVEFTEKIAQKLAPPIDVFNPVYYQTFSPPWFDNPAVASQTEQTQNQLGFYFQDQVKIDRLTLLFSGRLDQVKSDTVNLFTNAGAPQDDNAFSGRIGAIYQFDNGIAPYAAYATSFNPTLGAAFGGAPFEPTTGELYEAGVKYQPAGYNSFVQVSVFQLTQQNVLTPDQANPGFLTQIGEIQSRGVELEAKLSVTDRFNVIAAASYADVEVVNSGKRPVNVPATLASLWGDYTIRDGQLNGLGFGAGVRYTGDTYADRQNFVEVPSYTVVDAVVNYDFGAVNPDLKGLRLSVNAMNLFDKVYASQCTYANVFGPNTNCVYGIGRTVLATLRYRW